MRVLPLLFLLFSVCVFADDANKAADESAASDKGKTAEKKEPTHEELFETLLGEAIYNLEQAKRPLLSLELLEKALALKPDEPNVLGTKGIAQAEAGQLDKAMETFAYAIKVTEDAAKRAGILYNQGMVMLNVKDFESAFKAFEKSIEANKEFFPAYIKAAQAQRELGSLPEAIKYLEMAVKVNAEEPSTYLYLGDSYNNMKHFDKASEMYKLAIEKTPTPPGNPPAVVGLADALGNQKKYRESMEVLDRFARDSGNPDVLRALIRTKRTLCDWTDWVPMMRGVIEQAERGLENQGPSFLLPYQTLYLPTNPRFQQAVARSHSAAIKTAHRPAPPAWLLGHGILPTEGKKGSNNFDADRSKKKLRLGYLSRRFEDYPGTQLMLRVFGLHDRAKFEVICFANGPSDNSEIRATVEKDCDKFHDISLLNLDEATMKVANEKIDILIDYDGHHSFNSLPLVSNKPAPVQVTWLGFAGTTGMEHAIDYILADKFVIKDNEAGFYSEKPVFLPNTYQPQDHLQPIALKMTRADAKLPEDAVVFACFNRNDKIEPDVWKAWMEILRRVEKSVLWLFEDDVDGLAGTHLQDAAEAAGIDRERIIFTKRLPKPEHLARHQLADLFLDTFYYGAHTTASDSLWAGLPVLTMPGQTFASRVAGSLNKAAGMEELTMATIEEYVNKAVELGNQPALLEYVNKAVELGNQPALLAALKQKLKDNRPPKKPLFDTPKFVKNLELAYLAMWKDKSDLCAEKITIGSDYLNCWTHTAKFLSKSPQASISIASL
eukprot:g3893.t1